MNCKQISWASPGPLATLIFIVLFTLTVRMDAQQSRPCALSAERVVTICIPTEDGNNNSPVRILAGILHSKPIIAMQVYLDNVKVYEGSGDVVDTNLILAAGTHRLTVQAVDAKGVSKKTMSLVTHNRYYGQFAYVANSSDGTISGLAMDSTGFLRHNGYTFAREHPASLAETAWGLVYVAGGRNIRGYRRGLNGRLTEVPGSPFACGDDCRAIGINGPKLFAADYARDVLYGFFIDSETGSLIPIAGAPFATGSKPSSVVVSDRWVFVTNEGSSGVSSYAIDSSSGALTLVRDYRPAGTAPGSLVVDPSQKFLYAADPVTDSVYGYRIVESGDLEVMGGSPFQSLGSQPSGLAVYPSGAFLYVANKQSGTIATFRLDSNGVPRFSGIAASGPKPVALKVDPEGRYLLAVNDGSPYELWQYKINLTTGALTFVRKTRIRGVGSSILITSGAAPLQPASGFLYVGAANEQTTSGKVFAFAIADNGGLIAVSGSPFSHPSGATALAVHPSGKTLYVPGLVPKPFTSLIAQYSVNQTSGGLTARPSFVNPSDYESRNIVVDWSGRFVYLTAPPIRTEAAYWGYTLGSDELLGGALWYGADDNRQYIGIDPVGKFAYLLYPMSSAKINAETGYVVEITSQEYSLSKIVIDPTGRFAYGVSEGTSEVTSFAISGSNGKLSVASKVFTVGANPSDIVVDPHGLFVFISDKSRNTVTVFKIDRGSGKLSAVSSQPVQTGWAPVAIVVDATGKYLYVANEQSRNINVFSISSTGTLKPIVGSPFAATTSGLLTSIVASGALR